MRDVLAAGKDLGVRRLGASSEEETSRITEVSTDDQSNVISYLETASLGMK